MELKGGKGVRASGPNIFDYHHYRSDLMNRHGLTEEVMANLKKHREATGRRGKRKGHDGGEPEDARTHALASARARDAPLAE